jgi:prephenate dehydrogenase
MKTLGLIGFGRFGNLLYNQLKDALDIQIFDPIKVSEPTSGNLPFTHLAEICKNDLIILAVPVSKIESVCQEMKPHVPNDSIIMDVCAVKSYTLKVMSNCFSDKVKILGTHPLFGPDSVQESMRDHLMILTPYRISKNKLKQIKKFWESFGIKIIEMTPDEQDRLMAWTLAMTHFLGRSLNGLPLPETNIATQDYRNLINLMEKINQDTWELYEDMHRYNPYTVEMRTLLLESMQQMKEKLDKSQIQEKFPDNQIK